MKKIVLSMMMATGFYALVAAQDTCVFYLTPGVTVQKEVVLKSVNELFDINLKIGVKWFQIDNKIQILFDRKSVQGNDFSQILFSFYKKPEPVKTAVDCKSRQKVLWSKLKSADAQSMKYFIKADSLRIEDYSDCYKTLAINNEEEFTFTRKGEGDFVVTLPGFFVVKTEKRPWYTFSKRDKRVQFVTKPIDLYMQFERKPGAPERCGMKEAVVAYIEAYKRKLDENIADLSDAQKNKNCTYFNLLKDIMRRTFVELNDKCERYTPCEEVAAAIKTYNTAFEKAFAQQCSAPAAMQAAPATTCSLSESEISSINNRLKNLQMKITVKKRNSESADEEVKEYQMIKSTIIPRLTPDCRKKYKQLIDALESYCVNIENML